MRTAGLTPHIQDVARRFAKGFDYLRSLDVVDGERIAMNGYCFGGGITWHAAVEMPRLKATATFYGPAPDLDKVPSIKPAFFGVYDELDQRITGAMPALRAALAATDVRHKLTVYPGVDHAFHNDPSERYNQTQATAAWQDTRHGSVSTSDQTLLRKNVRMSDPSEFIDEALRRESSWMRADEAQTRLGKGLRYYGSSIGAIRGTVRDTLRRYPQLTHDEVTALSSELWEPPVFERRFAAIVLLQSNIHLLTNTDLTRLEGFVREARLRELVDPLAVDVIGPLIAGLEGQASARAGTVLDRWVRERDEWLSRAAVMSPLRELRAGGGDWDAFVRRATAGLDAARGRAGDASVVRDAVSTVLDEVSKRRPELQFPLQSPDPVTRGASEAASSASRSPMVGLSSGCAGSSSTADMYMPSWPTNPGSNFTALSSITTKQGSFK